MDDDHDATLPALADMPPASIDLGLLLADIDTVDYPVVTGDGRRVTRWDGIHDDDVAEWAMAKLAQIDQAIEDRKAHAERLMARIDDWFHHEMEQRRGEWPSLRQQREFFMAHLEAYARAQREEKDRKTVSLVSGEIATREQPARLVIEDEDDLIDWASHHYPDLIRTRVDVPVSALKEALALAQDDSILVDVKTGEPLPDLPPGLAIEPAHVTVKVKRR